MEQRQILLLTQVSDSVYDESNTLQEIDGTRTYLPLLPGNLIRHSPDDDIESV